ncbi:MAG: glutaredoxin family protein [Gammaproteobacteria bacterium]|nr:glutaredoxin family protein [Gammaproteobacteria bacterium]
MLAELQPHCAALGADLAVVDVDSDAQLLRRYGLKVPVLLLDGEPVCHGRLDLAELRRLMRGRE